MAKTTDKKVVKTEKTEKPKKTVGFVKGGALNIREEADKLSKIVGVLENSTKVEILGEKDDFYKVKDGYCMKKFIEISK